MSDETLDTWLNAEIESAEHLYGHLRSYKDGKAAEALAALNALKSVRTKMQELWGVSRQR